MASELEALRDEGLVATVGISGYEEADVAIGTGGLQLARRGAGARQRPGPATRRFRASWPRCVIVEGGSRPAASCSREPPWRRPSTVYFGVHPDVVRLRASGTPWPSASDSSVRSRGWMSSSLRSRALAELVELMEMMESPMPGVDWPMLASRDPWLIDPRQWTAPTREG